MSRHARSAFTRCATMCALVAVPLVLTPASAESTPSISCERKQAGWERIALGGPAPRREVLIAYDQNRRALVLHGGLGGGVPATRLRDTWEWTGDAWITSIFIEPPQTEAGAALAYDANLGEVVLFGGGFNAPDGTFVHINTMWGWEPPKWSVVSTGGPEPRSGALLAFDDARRVLVMHGGWAGVGAARTVFTDTWEFAKGEWTRIDAPGPPPRIDAAMAYDSERHVMVLFGGRDDAAAGGPAYLSDVWEWNGGAWTQSSVAGAPPARADHAMAFDPHLGVMVVLGGRTATTWFADTWEFDGSAWRVVSDGGPIARAGHGLAYDELHAEVLCFGGLVVGAGVQSLTQGLWAREADAPLFVERNPLSLLVQRGQDATLHTWVSGSGPLAYHWRRNGVPLEDGDRIVGARTSSLKVLDADPTDRARYDAIVTNICGRTIQTGSALLAVGSWCLTDLTADNLTNEQDLAALLGAWGPCSAPCPADFNLSGVVDAADLSFILGQWGSCQ